MIVLCDVVGVMDDAQEDLFVVVNTFNLDQFQRLVGSPHHL